MADAANTAMQREKRCLKCGETKPEALFHRDRNRKDGRYPYCKVCATGDVKRHQATLEWKARKRAYDKARCDTMRDKINAANLEHYYANPAPKKAASKRWAQSNPERRQAIAKSYKARRRAVERQGIGGAELLAWSMSQAKVCYWCGCKCARKFHVDHYYPLSKGGAHEVCNLVIACPSCNLRKSAKSPIDFAREVGRLL